MAITREVARNAEAEVRWKNEEADRLEADAKAARERAAAATKESQAIASQWEKIETGQKLAVGAELRRLRTQVDGLLAERSDLSRPPVEARVLARIVLLLSDPLADPVKVARLSALDPRYAALAGAQDTVQHFAVRNSGLNDAALNDAADDLEVSCHRAVLARLRWLAGEE